MYLAYRRKILLSFALAGILAYVLVEFLSGLSWIAVLESKLNRHIYRANSYEGKDYSVVVVAIDEKSFASLKKNEALTRYTNLNWPWPPVLHAQLLEQLAGAGADRIGFDLMFSEPFDAYKAEYASFDPLVTARAEWDIPVVLAAKNEEGIYTGPLPRLLEAGFMAGLVNAPIHASGEIRRYRYLQDEQDSFVLALARAEGGERDLEHNGWIETSLGKDCLISFRNTPGNDFPVISYTDVLLGQVPESIQSRWGLSSLSELVNGKAVLIGRTTMEAHDIFSTPFGNMPGVDIHAHALEALYHPEGLLPREPGALARVALILGAIMIGFVLLFFFRSIVCLVPSLLLTLLYLISAGLVFSHDQLLLPVLPVIAGHYLFLGLANAFMLSIERKEKRFLQGAFGKYLSPSVARTLINNPDLVRLGGEERMVTVLFSDIAGFTSISESMEAPALLKILNEYLTLMTREILDRDGTLDKYIGDAIMAFWGAPVEIENHAFQACVAALEMQKKLQAWNKEVNKQSRPAINCRIGIHTGPAVIGNAGSDDRFDYTAIGDTVNTASRLEGLGKLYGVSVIISGITLEKVKDKFDVRLLDRVAVKGKKEATDIYELLDVRGQANQKLLSLNQEAMEAYFKKEWAKAIELFTLKYEQYKDLHSQVFINRLNEIKADPKLHDAHTGIFVLKRK